MNLAITKTEPLARGLESGSKERELEHERQLMRPDFEDLPFFERPDLTPYLVHLTKNTKAEDDFSAFENLVSILQTGKIWGSDTRKGFVKGPHRAACFMDLPFNALKYVLNKQNSSPSAPRYEAFGVFVTKKHAYKAGCRPVLYLSNKEKKQLWIHTDELWRVVRFEASDEGWISWLHEREWRCKGSYELPTNVGVLVRNSVYVERLTERLQKEPKEFKVHPRAIIPLTILCQGLPQLPTSERKRKG